MKNVIVIDNFYNNPWGVRDYALTKATYLSSEQLNPQFAGTESIKGFYNQDIVRKIEDALGFQIQVEPKKFSFGVFSKTLSKDEQMKSIHVDSSDWTALLYLSRPEDCVGGTVFYEHKELGWNEIPNEEAVRLAGFGTREEFIRGPLKEHSKDFSKWKISSRIGMKFNRLVLFRSGNMFHAAEGYFGESDENCRLLQLFFFNQKEV